MNINDFDEVLHCAIEAYDKLDDVSLALVNFKDGFDCLIDLYAEARQKIDGLEGEIEHLQSELAACEKENRELLDSRTGYSNE